MKSFITLLLLSVFLLILPQCKTTEKVTEIQVYQDSIQLQKGDELRIHIKKGKSFNHPTFVIWEEDMQGNYLRTIFITQSYASGIFGYKMLNDSTWLKTAGPSYQPAALPYWTFRKGVIDEEHRIPTPDHPFIDAYTAATPKTDFEFKTGTEIIQGQKRILLEVNQTWDWNSFWTNNKYPENAAYKHSAQPSLVYAVVVNKEDKVFYLNPIGHGDPKGETGKLFTDISSLTTAKDIFQNIKITLQ
jgi:hypothetical protein